MNNIEKINSIEQLGSNEDEFFSPSTHPVLESFISKVIDANKKDLPNDLSQKFVRKFFLYGFLRASGQVFEEVYSKSQSICEKSGHEGIFDTNNGVLALSDFDGEVYIRGGDSYHGYFDMGDGKKPQGVEGTLLNLGYDSGGVFVPHSNCDIYKDPSMEKLFKVLRFFSREIRNLRGEPTGGIIIKDLTEPEPDAYKARNPDLPKIILNNLFLIPGNKNKTIKLKKDKLL